MGCQVSNEDNFVYVNKVGAFRITSTPYWCGRLSGALVKLSHYLVGPGIPLEGYGSRKRGTEGGSPGFCLLGCSRVPFQVEEAPKECWLSRGCSPLGFAATALPWEKPFLGPLYVFSSAVINQKGQVVVPWAVLMILDWIATRLEAGEN